RGREIRGRVVDRNGQPIRMANVSARQPSVMGYIPNVQTDDDGQFTVSGLEDGRYTVRANKNGWVGASIDDVDPAAARPLTLTLDRGATITGRVIGLPPEELPQVHVSASGNNAGSSQQTDASGNFALSGIPDGSVTITAYRQGMPQRQSAPKVIDVVNGSAPPVEIDFSAGITIRGRVTRNGTPVVAGNISFNARGRSMGRVAYATIGPDGSYEVDGVEPGDYDVRVFSMGLNDAVPYTVVSNATFDIDLKGATIRGVALDADSGAPLPDVRVYASSSSPDSRSGRNAATDSNGVFSLDALPDGTYTVRGEREHYAAAVQKLTVSGGSSAPIELRLSRGQEAVVRVVDAESGATIDGSVGLIDKQTKKFAGSSGYGRGDDGAIHVWAVPGSYTARVSAMNYMPESVDVVVPGPEVRVALHRGGTITVTSRSGGRFNIVPPSAPGGVVGGVITIGSGQGRGVSIPPGGRMSFSSLSAGVYEIDKYADDGKTVARRYTVTLPAGQTVTLDAD
ncbi:MAG TPA: carboxypeptidase regulatory-like domain-containing protein, partial [Thermoanaerobaculia bacterium]|nr:carboxypeptidase regulatory-like domain-containing protein [Thermoanaerobaculia bacterium]